MQLFNQSLYLLMLAFLSAKGVVETKIFLTSLVRTCRIPLKSDRACNQETWGFQSSTGSLLMAHKKVPQIDHH